MPEDWLLQVSIGVDDYVTALEGWMEGLRAREPDVAQVTHCTRTWCGFSWMWSPRDEVTGPEGIKQTVQAIQRLAAGSEESHRAVQAMQRPVTGSDNSQQIV